MRKTLSVLTSVFVLVVVIGPLAGCGDDIKTVKTIETQQQEPVRMVSPGTEIVE